MKINEWWKNLKYYKKVGYVAGGIYLVLDLLLRYFSHRGFQCGWDLRGEGSYSSVLEIIPSLLGTAIIFGIGSTICLIYPSSKVTIKMIVHSELGRALFSVVFELLGTTLLVIILVSFFFKIVSFFKK